MILGQLSFWADVGSIIGFGMTVAVAVHTRNLGKYYRRHIELPRLVNRLRVQNRNLSQAIEDRNPLAVKSILSKCVAEVERIPSYGDRLLQERARFLQEEIRRTLNRNGAKLFADAAKTHLDIGGIIQAATSFLGEDRWK